MSCAPRSSGDSLPPPTKDAARERTILMARVLAGAAYAESVWGSGIQAPGYADRAVALARQTDDLEANADALSSQAMAAVFSGRGEDAMAIHQAVIDLAEQRGDVWMVTMVEAGAALAMLASGDIAAAERRQARATEASIRSGNPFAIAFAALNRGRIAGWTGNLEEARPWFAQAQEGYRQIGDERFELVSRSDFAHVVRRSGALDQTRPCTARRSDPGSISGVGAPSPISSRGSAFSPWLAVTP